MSTPDVFVAYTSSPPKNSCQKVRLCSWCKKSTVLKDFTSSDGEKVVSCKGLCSATCFEQAMKNIKENDVHITNTQENLRSQGLPGTNKTGECLSKSTPPPPHPRRLVYLKGKVGGLKREEEINFVLLKRGLIREGGAIEDL